jgi:hypothetical protein
MLCGLFAGIQHYIASNPFYNDPYEVLFMFLMGERIKPVCTFKEQDESGETIECDQLAESHDVALCRDHRCEMDRCNNEIKPGYALCIEHVCGVDECAQPRIHPNELFCVDHVCFQCVLLGKRPASEALDEPPRNVCEQHQLCSVLDCQELAVTGEDYCAQHRSTKCKFENCNEWAIARGLPFCRHHEKEMEKLRTKSLSVTTRIISNETGSDKSSRRQCMGKNKKRKPCKSNVMSGSDFCEAHAPKEGVGFKAEQKAREQQSNILRKDEKNYDESIGNECIETATVDSAKAELATEEEYGPPPDLDNLDLEVFDNSDELIEGDGALHIREIFDIESGDEEESEQDEFQECMELEEDKFHECRSAADDDIGRTLSDPREWIWSLSLDNRWAACQAFLYEQCEQLDRIQGQVKQDLPLARKRFHEAETRAKARVFENKTVIGGTIVGCIARLEQIRATRPFAVSFTQHDTLPIIISLVVLFPFCLLTSRLLSRKLQKSWNPCCLLAYASLLSSLK